MRKHALPTTLVWPLATLVRDPITLQVETDKKGRPLWDMPEPKDQVANFQMVKEPVEQEDGKVKMVLRKKAVLFPVYRGVSAEMIRYARSQAKRMHRLEGERRANRLLEEAKEPILEIEEAIGENNAPTE